MLDATSKEEKISEPESSNRFHSFKKLENIEYTTRQSNRNIQSNLFTVG